MDDATLLAIGGESGNVFDIADFEQLNGEREERGTTINKRKVSPLYCITKQQ